MKTILFICYPDVDSPIGGVKQIYRQVELLCSLGFDAKVLHQNPDFRASWFESTAPVTDIAKYLAQGPCANSDLIVFPETWVQNIPNYLPGIKKVIFNQNAYYTFGLNGSFDSSLLSYYYHNDVIGIVTVSEDNRQYLVSGCGLPSESVYCLLNGIDSTLFYPPQ